MDLTSKELSLIEDKIIAMKERQAMRKGHIKILDECCALGESRRTLKAG